MTWISSIFARLLRSRSKPLATEDKGHLRVLYFQTAIQYQIAGRFSAIAGFSPVSGNLFHHAIEFYLKGVLVENFGESKRRKFGHDVRKLWRRYKREFGNSSFDKYDQTIGDLHKFERIRYPEEIATRGMRSEVGFARNNAAGLSTLERPPYYQLVVPELDELVKVIFETSSTNPQFFTGSLHPDAVRYLKERNQTSMW